jgi:hypothetical protein
MPAHRNFDSDIAFTTAFANKNEITVSGTGAGQICSRPPALPPEAGTIQLGESSPSPRPSPPRRGRTIGGVWTRRPFGEDERPQRTEGKAAIRGTKPPRQTIPTKSLRLKAAFRVQLECELQASAKEFRLTPNARPTSSCQCNQFFSAHLLFAVGSLPHWQPVQGTR